MLSTTFEPSDITINGFRNYFFNCQYFLELYLHIVLNVVKDERRLVI